MSDFSMPIIINNFKQNFTPITYTCTDIDAIRLNVDVLRMGEIFLMDY